MHWRVVLTFLGDVLGAIVIASGILKFSYAGSMTSLWIALAVIIAGPLEDILTRWAVRRGRDADQRRQLAHLVDLSTSIGFLVCLGLAIWMA